MFFSPIESKIVYLKWSDLKLGGLCWNSDWWNRVCVLIFAPHILKWFTLQRGNCWTFANTSCSTQRYSPPKMYLQPWVFTLRRNPKKTQNLPGFTAFCGFVLTPKKKIWTWKAKCLIFKAIVAGFRGFQLPKKIGHLAFQGLEKQGPPPNFLGAPP